MKRFITYLACATLVVSGSYAIQRKAAKAELQSPNHASVMSFAAFQSQSTEQKGERYLTHPAKARMAQGATSAVAPKAVAAPWTCDFEDYDAFYSLWETFDGDADGNCWLCSDGRAMSRFNYDIQVDDWMITKEPITLTAGEAYIAFEYGTYMGYESFEVLYGTSPERSLMQSLEQWENVTASPNPLTPALVTFTIPADGDYYFAFHSYSDPGQYFIFIDNVEINNGIKAGSPDAAVTSVSLPTPSPLLGDQEYVAAKVSNIGSGSITSFDITVTTECNGNSTSSAPEKYNETIPSGGEIDVLIPIDLSAEGIYTVTVTASNIVEGEGDAPETNTSNNSASSSTTHFGVTDVPFTTDFSTGASPADWTSDESWEYDNYYYNAMVCQGTTPLYSKGVNMEAGKAYRISINYMAGADYYPFGQMLESYDLLCGLADGNLPVISSVKDDYTNNEFIDRDFTYTCSTTGVYQLAFKQDYTYGSFYIKSVSITEVPAYDVSINVVSVAPSRLPAALAGTVASSVAIENRGTEAVSGTVTATVNGNEVTTAPFTGLAASDNIVCDLSYSLAAVAVGNDAMVEFSVAITGHEDASPADNTASVTTLITEDEFAYDRTTDDKYNEYYTIGTGMNTLTVALPIHLTVADVLTGISVGIGRAVEQPIGLSVYKYDRENNVVGNCILSEESPIMGQVGQIRFDISPRALEPGDYMVCATVPDFLMVCDMVKPGILYIMVTDDDSNHYLIDQSPAGLGSAALRAIFGEGTAAVNDLKVNAITSPRGNGLFAANQPITVSITNNGTALAEGTLTVTVNGTALAPRPIAIDSYATTTYTVEADLSAPGEYTIVATAELAGDENPDDNSVTSVVTCMEPADPYVMDFESCNDFATDGFNPVWTTYDGDESTTWSFSGISFPGACSKFAFIVFNPDATTPAMIDEETGEIMLEAMPHSGEKFGASFAAGFRSTTAVANDDWLISPLLTMPDQNANVSMYVQSYMSSVETYEVLVSTTDNNPESFVVVKEEAAAANPVYDDNHQCIAAGWEYIEVDLSAYNGQEIYIAIHCTSSNQFIFMIDDIVVSKPESGIAGTMGKAKLALYPNPATDMVVISADGQSIEEAAIYSASGAMVGHAKSATGEIRYNISGLASGIYFAKVKTRAGTQVIKFVKK